MANNILNINCPSCGAPAEFDIVHQDYRCKFCGGKVSLEGAKKEKEQYTQVTAIHTDKDYDLEVSSCTGCGATVLFEKDEALSKCEFCGRSLVRKRYTKSEEMPRFVVPFGLTREEAEGKILDWCSKNHGKSEAAHLKEKLPQMHGYYLPYEMVKGPVHTSVNKSGEATRFEAHGYLNGEFINCSSQLDNLVLDAMEPFDLENLQEFDFGFVAGHRVKISDINNEKREQRLNAEAEANYRVRMEKLWGTRDIRMETKVEPVVKLPVLLPVYYITDGPVKAAVNGQTGKVSVSAEKDGSYFAIPWWLKGIAVLLIAMAATYAMMVIRGMGHSEALGTTGILGFFYLIVFAAMFSDGGSKEFGIKHYRIIYNSGEQAYRREGGRLVPSDHVLKRQIAEPVFLRKLEGKEREVSYTFSSPFRMLRMIALAIVTVFFPVILALFVNGFDFQRLALGGSAVWFCIAVPVVPIYIIRFGIQWLYDNPLVYVFKDGKRVRYRKKIDINGKTVGNALLWAVRLLIIPPVSLIVWAVLASMAVMVYLTAFGF